ncbi:MAG: hypothetical protein AAGG38_07710 [Planctomycetota bacterium]
MKQSTLSMAVAFGVAVALHALLLPVGAGVLRGQESAQAPARLQVVWEAAEVAGASVDGRLRVTNAGNGSARELAWSFYLSRDRELEAGSDMRLTESGNGSAEVSTLEPGRARERAVKLDRPTRAAGPWFLVAEAAWEGGAARATRAVWLDSGEPARVSVAAVASPGSALSGGLVSLGYTVENAEDAGWAKTGGGEAVWLSADDTVSAADDLLLYRRPRRRAMAPGAVEPVVGPRVRVPLGVEPGDYRVIVETDGPGREREQAVVDFVIQPAEAADVVVDAVEFPAEVVAGEPAAIRFGVVNQSPRGTGPGLWKDRVYLSVDDRLSGDDVELLTMPRMSALPGRGGYVSGPTELVVPTEAAVSTQMFLIISADDDGELFEGDYEDNNTEAVPVVIRPPAAEAEVPELKLGREDEPDRVTVAWIAYDAFEELRAREAATLQPALQTQADPVPDAPLERDPDAAAGASAPASRPSPEAAQRAAEAIPAAEQRRASSVDPVEVALAHGELPTAERDPADQAGDATQDTAGPRLPEPREAQAPPPTPRVAETKEGDKPTSAPRDEREADPTALVDSDAVRLGGVLVGPGLEVKTFRPRFSAAARVSAIPRNPLAAITFDPTDGTVVEAVLVRSTGFDNVDAPILSSLYRWKVTGDRLQRMERPFTIRITLLLGAKEAGDAGNESDRPER